MGFMLITNETSKGLLFLFSVSDYVLTSLLSVSTELQSRSFLVSLLPSHHSFGSNFFHDTS